MSLPDAFKDELRARVPLSDVIGKRMKLTRAGHEYKGCCPFHKEKTPSFTVNDQKGFYHCFGCGAHGDSIGFLMNHDNMSFMDAVEQLASLAGMQVPKSSPADEQRYKQQSRLYDLMELAAKHYEQQLHAKENKKILQYLVERGLSLDIIKSFRLGYAPDAEAEDLKKALTKAGFKADDLTAAGLFKDSSRKQGDVYAFFRNRIIFPVTDIQGRTVAFGGRVLPPSHGGPADKSAPKYINSPETPIFHKGRGLYGLSRARKALGDGKVAVVVEGYMDVIALAQAGFKAPVAPLGTALTEEQIETLWKAMPEGKRTPILCFDGDTAGQRAARRAMERVLPLLKPDHSVKFAFLPQEHDPDSLIKAEGRPAMERVLKNTISLFDMIWQDTARGRDMTQPEVKAGFRAALEKHARNIADLSVQKFFVNEIKQRIDSLFLTEKPSPARRGNKAFHKGKPLDIDTPYRPHGLKVPPLKSRKNRQRDRVCVLLGLMINYPALYAEFGENLGMIPVADAEHDALRQALFRLLDTQNNLDYQAVKQHLREQGHGETLESILNGTLHPLKPGQALDIARQAWQDVWDIGFRDAKTA
ncbi:MAG: DNA primase [Alphaproteobacteria bacterium]|nr:DNA primase [Alphaproteobacteria bacterium]